MQPDHIESSYQEDLRYNPYLLRTGCLTVLFGLIYAADHLAKHVAVKIKRIKRKMNTPILNIDTNAL